MCSEILQGSETFLHGPQTQREVVGISPLQPLPLLPSSWVNLDGRSLATHSMASSLMCPPGGQEGESHSVPQRPASLPCATLWVELPSWQFPTEPQSKGTGQVYVCVWCPALGLRQNSSYPQPRGSDGDQQIGSVCVCVSLPSSLLTSSEVELPAIAQVHHLRVLKSLGGVNNLTILGWSTNSSSVSLWAGAQGDRVGSGGVAEQAPRCVGLGQARYGRAAVFCGGGQLSG